jgi:ribosomal protein S18 acetylase RimI-like enzyme
VIPLQRPFRPATPADAVVLAELVNHAGEGLPLSLWDKMTEPGETAWDVGRRRAARDEGSFSYRNAAIIEQDGQAAGSLIGYGIAKDPEPLPDDVPAMFRPLLELEALAPDTWYVNVLAVLPGYRGLGLGSQLLALAEEIGRAEGKAGMSIIVSDANDGARRLYERTGYRFVAERTMVKEDWQNPGKNWVLLVK